MRVLLADDHDLLRDTLAMFLEHEGDIAVSSAATFGEAREAVARGPRFDLVLLDLNMPGMDGIEGIRRMRAMPDAPPVALISGQVNADAVGQALAAGASGFVPKTLSARSLVHAIRLMAMGERFVPVECLTAPRRDLAAGLRLSEREIEVLRGLSIGLANKEIARRIQLSEATVKLHVKTLYRKLGVANRTQAAITAREAGIG